MKKALVVMCALLCIAGMVFAGGRKDTKAAASNERVKVTFQTIDFYAGQCNVGQYADQILKQIEDYCGCDLEIEWVLNDVLSEKITLTLANPKQMPMIMTYGGTLTGNIVSAAKDGAFVDLSKYIWDEKKYPNLSKMLKSVADSLTVDGQLVAIPRTRVVGRYGLTYRQDWADKLGIAEPKNADDVYDMLYAFTYGDPDGNGINDTIGMEMTSYTGPFDIIQTWFGCGNEWAEVNGKLVPVHMQDEYMVALDWLKKVYDNGLMPADWAVRTTDTWSNGCKTGQNGVYIDVIDGGRRVWEYFTKEATFTPSVVDPSKPASMNLYGAVNGRTLATAGYNGFFTLSASTCNTPEKIEAALTLLDKLNDDEMLILTQYGLEGINYHIDEEGYLVDDDTTDTTLAANYMGLNQLLAFLPSAEHVTEPHVKNTIYVDAQNAAYAKALESALVNPAASFLINSETYADIGATLAEIIKQARTQYICGEINKTQLQDAWKRWYDQGGKKIIDEVNVQFAANK
ncbi:MAG: extracellular solute-binding protein [Treponemataceae bacterium]|nr:extracellular solute-binding protein [Treponemataceae bacterium]